MAEATRLSLAPHPLRIGMRPRPLPCEPALSNIAGGRFGLLTHVASMPGYHPARPNPAADQSPETGSRELDLRHQVSRSSTGALSLCLLLAGSFSRRSL